MYAKDEANDIDAFSIDDACLISGAVAVLPTGSFVGWSLMPDADTAEIEGIVLEERSAECFLDENGECYAGDDEFNTWVETSKFSHRTDVNDSHSG